MLKYSIFQNKEERNVSQIVKSDWLH